MKETNAIPAEIKMKTESRQFEDINQHLFEESGRFVEMNGNYYIRFEESYDDGNKVPVMVKITSDQRVNLIRYGGHKTNLLFDSQSITYTKLATPAGLTELEVQTNNMQIAINNQPISGEININYTLHMNGQELGDYQIDLHFTT